MTTNLIIFPVVVPMLAGVVSLLARERRTAQRAIGYAGVATNLVIALVILAGALAGGGGGRVMVLQGGDWPAPFGITVVVDPLAALMLAAAALVLFSTYLYCDEQVAATAGGLFHPLFHFLAMGVQWSILAGDLFNLFVAFEIMLTASYALLVLGTTRAQMRHAYKYVLINLLASTLFVTCCGLVYGQLGTLNLADLTQLSHGGQLPPGAVPVVALLLLVFGAKTAMFPLWFWLPDSYPTMSAGVGAVFAGLLTKVGAYVLIRMFVMVFADPAVTDVIRPVILAAAAVTMFLGVLGAVSRNTVRQILSNHIMSQVGYMILAVGLGIAVGISADNRELAVAGGIFFILHNMIVKSSLFLCGGLMCRYAGSDELDRMGGLARRAPWLAALFLVAALSLAGLPPLGGFFAKFVLIRESVRAEHFTLAAVALGTSVLTLLSMVKIWCYAFWSRAASAPAEAPPRTRPVAAAMTGTSLLVAAAVVMGLGAEPVMRATRTAARTVVEPSAYVDAVLAPDKVHPLRVAAAGEEDGRP